MQNTAPAASDMFDISIEELDTVAGGLSVGCLATGSCPVACFSTLSN